MTSKMNIANIAAVQTGVYQTPKPSGDILYLQTRHFNAVGEYDPTSQPERINNIHLHNHILNDGDILFAAKGTKNFAALYRSEMGKAVASSSLFVIRIRENIRAKALPEFLCWYINSIDGQAFLKSHAKGTALPSIPLSVIQEMELSLPTIQSQRQIVAIHALRLREKELHSKIERLKDQVIQRQLLSFTK
jgi:restriction endonuclease S subunit